MLNWIFFLLLVVVMGILHHMKNELKKESFCPEVEKDQTAPTVNEIQSMFIVPVNDN